MSKSEKIRSYVALKKSSIMYKLLTQDIKKIYRIVNKKLPPLPKYDETTSHANHLIQPNIGMVRL